MKRSMRPLLVCLAFLLSSASSSLALAEKPYLIPSPAEGKPASASAIQQAPSLTLEPSLLALRELSLLRQREATLWQEHDKIRLGGPIAAIAVGVPMLSFLVTGAFFLSDSAGYQDDITLLLGRSFTAVGVLALASVCAGAVRLTQLKQRRREQEGELRAISKRRTVLEQVLQPLGQGLRF